MPKALFPHFTTGSRKRAEKLGSEFGGTFDRHKAIFIHIPKAAGTSIAFAIFGHQISHHSITHYYARNYEKASDYFKFTFVRDPLARLVSAYRYLAAGGMNSHDRDFARRYIQDRSLPQVVEQLSTDPKFLDSLHFRPQFKFVTHPQRAATLLVNYVGRVETLADDIRYVLQRLELNSHIPQLNRSTNQAPIDDIELRSLREAVYRIYEYDYELFGYPRA